MGYKATSLEVGAIIPPRLRHHCEPAPVRPENPDHPGSHTVSHQDIETPVPVYGVVNILEVQEYFM